jgi:electron transfer flavoprotein alpha subunit
MSVLVFADNSDGIFKKTAFEIVSFGKQVAKQAETSLVVVTINANDVSSLSTYGPDKILKIQDSKLDSFNAKAYADCVHQAANKESADIVVVDSTNNGLYLAPILAVKLAAGYASNVVDYPSSMQPLTVKRKAFSSKGFSFTEIHTENKLLGLAKNSVGLTENHVDSVIEDFVPSLKDDDFKISSASVDKSTGTVTIADADTVVSGGRGLKGPENWGMIEELAEVLGAATACSKPVSDLGWRPHSEHVGQTGKPVTSNLYIAIGISGAIQHLAGVNSSKVKVVINNDAEAPFFKAADYGIVGDAFEVVPQLISKLKEFKSTL